MLNIYGCPTARDMQHVLFKIAPALYREANANISKDGARSSVCFTIFNGADINVFVVPVLKV